MQDDTDDSALLAELRAVRAEVERLNRQKLFQNERSLRRVMLWGLMRGLSFGLGSALGATILISTLVSNSDKAMSVVPLALIPQLVFALALMPLPPAIASRPAASALI